MATSSFSKATLVINSFSRAISRRGYASQPSVSSLSRSGGGVVIKRRADDATSQEKPSAWGPDPKTGYYRPENRREEIDVAELRAALLSHSH